MHSKARVDFVVANTSHPSTWELWTSLVYTESQARQDYIVRQSLKSYVVQGIKEKKFDHESYWRERVNMYNEAEGCVTLTLFSESEF